MTDAQEAQIIEAMEEGRTAGSDPQPPCAGAGGVAATVVPIAAETPGTETLQPDRPVPTVTEAAVDAPQVAAESKVTRVLGPCAPEDIRGALQRLRERTKKRKFEWDVFISYRVDADSNVVKELYWQLVSTEINVDGETRKLNVFWDKKCLKDGFDWEDGFAQAICSAAVVVVVMSRGTFKMEGKRHDIEALTAESTCDNVLLEYALALSLHEIKGTAIMPLLVGDNDASGKGLSHFFKSGCMPGAFPDVNVRSIDEKLADYLTRKAGVDPEKSAAALTIKQIMGKIMKFQGAFLQGLADEAVEGAVPKIHRCVRNVLEAHQGRQEMQTFQFSTPQGEEVCQFLADNALSCYASILAKNKINSLRKLSMLTAQQLDTLHGRVCDTVKAGDDASDDHLGRRVAPRHARNASGAAAELIESNYSQTITKVALAGMGVFAATTLLDMMPSGKKTSHAKPAASSTASGPSPFSRQTFVMCTLSHNPGVASASR